MAGTTAGNPLDGLDEGLRSFVAEVPLPTTADVEFELRRLARQRLDPSTEADVASRSHRGSRSRRGSHQPVVGAFDSPEGFAFVSVEANRRR